MFNLLTNNTFVGQEHTINRGLTITLKEAGQISKSLINPHAVIARAGGSDLIVQPVENDGDIDWDIVMELTPQQAERARRCYNVRVQGNRRNQNKFKPLPA